MKRPTVADLAKEAGVSVTTIDRVINGRDKVRPSTAQRVLDAAERIGFYSEGAIRDRMNRAKPACNLGVLLQSHNLPYINILAHQLRAAAAAYEGARVTLVIETIEEFSPQKVAAKIDALGKKSDALAILTARYDVVAQAIERQREKGVPSFAMISELDAACSVGFVGVDNWKVGRTAAWVVSNLCRKPGKIGIVFGHHRYRAQELSEMGFRSYLRDQPSEFEVLEPLITWGDNETAYDLTKQLIEQTADLAALYISGGGTAGSLAAIRETGSSDRLITLCYHLTEETREALSDGTLNVVLAHPVKHVAKETILALVNAIGTDPEFTLPTVCLPIEIYSPENI
ncbi:LacI family DNA-binding transcriptional regulator [Rhodobacteraceae bacterium NNCM2]|nr:LacI family DNA-binding transcriptional regulator [Coraliihabitans acroporae]